MGGVVDNLQSTAKDKSLSANQGNVLNELIKPLRTGSAITSYNANDYTGTFAISVGDGSLWTNLPIQSHGMFICRNATDYIEQQFITQAKKYYRVSYNFGATWGDWVVDGGLAWTELLSANISTTETVYTINDMSKYRTLYFAIPYLDLVRGGIVIPYEIFKKIGGTNTLYILGGVNYEFLVKWVSDTAIKVTTNFVDGILPFVVYGY